MTMHMRDIINTVLRLEESASKDRFALDAEDEDSRVIDAYFKKHGYNRFDQLNMRPADWERVRTEALTNRHLYPIPKTDTDYLYHGTAKARLPYIAVQGIAPQDKSRWSKDGYAGHAIGRVFFTDTISKAMFYARQASKTRPVLLRVRRDRLPDIQPDYKEVEGCYFIERSVPSDQVEVWNGKTWIGVAATARKSR